ncbi:mechanosensitive ion channel family protein [Jeotgalibaca ciconiae]|uniref:Mechanosensitive ion channel family protein n=1 Tax=Jeotgalibaca ciconiae TaxID=2496265 RepID=A0A3S9HDT1_9LACT|nr:mechanosensitive ion channel family protein [Jeotgalibaca ciconiae]AZP05517.1 mechanosensitive ion channel family protein [Jeotgalibaca ciconiae]HJB22637.1 mechanosensitive ion channel family protein [Candidatus Jeotgalibaca pullicola]
MFFINSVANNAVDETIESVVESSNFIITWWNSINWSGIVSQVITKSIYIFFVLLVFTVINRLVKYFLKKTFTTQSKKAHVSMNRRNTIYKMVDNAVSYTIAFFLIYSILSIIGIPVSTLLAGAGIAGIAIGLGAQSFISDIVNGFFILLENQFDVGDSVTIGDFSGTVVSIGLRSTQLKGFDGTHHFLPNHTIDVISNNSRNDMRAMIELTLYPDTDFEIVKEIIEAKNKQLVPDYPEIVSGPNFVGPTNLGNGLVSYSIVFYTLNGQQFRVRDVFLTEYLQALKDANIDIPKNTFLGR